MKENPRLLARQHFYNKFDPLYIFLDRIVFRGLFHPRKANAPDEFEQLDIADIDFLVDNLKKHRNIGWLNVALVIYLFAGGIEAIRVAGDPAVVVTGLLAPAMITGAAWYTVSFGGIPEKFVRLALVLTFFMFLAFSLSMTLLTCLLMSITPLAVALGVLLPIYFSLYVASVLYDNVDGLKIGLDTTLLKFSRASLNYYQKHGFLTREETHTETYDSGDSQLSDRIALFTHYIAMLQRNIAQLEEQREAPIANHLIASSTDLLFSVVDLGSEQKLDRDGRFDSYLINAHKLGQVDVDAMTIDYLKLAIEGLRAILGAAPSAEIDSVSRTLSEFEKLRNTTGDVDQQLADHLFSQVFQQILSLMQAHRQRFLRSVD